MRRNPNAERLLAGTEHGLFSSIMGQLPTLMGPVLKLFCLSLWFVSTCLTALFGQMTQQTALGDAKRARLEQIAADYTKDNAFMGSVLVVEGETVLLNRGCGQADPEWMISNAPDVKLRLGSLTKPFTATLILLVQQDGKLDISDPVNKYLPDTPKAWEKITLANLLGHTSGIPSFTSFKEFGAWRMNPHNTEEELAFFRDRPLDFEPGSKFEYSNSNYEVLGAVIEKIRPQTLS